MNQLVSYPPIFKQQNIDLSVKEKYLPPDDYDPGECFGVELVMFPCQWCGKCECDERECIFSQFRFLLCDVLI